MYIIHHDNGNTDYSMVKPAYEENDDFYYADTGGLKINDLKNTTVNYSGLTVTTNGTTYSMTLLGKNAITIPKIQFDVYEQFVLTSATNDTLLVIPFYSEGISGYEQTTINVVAGNNTVQFKQKGRFTITSQTRISGNLPVIIESSISPRGDYIEVL